jgi:Cysteine-rich CWC
MKTALPDLNPCLCPLCRQPNACAMASPGAEPAGPCWCTRVHFSPELLQRVPEPARDKACICAACAQQNPESRRT